MTFALLAAPSSARLWTMVVLRAGGRAGRGEQASRSGWGARGGSRCGDVRGAIGPLAVTRMAIVVALLGSMIGCGGAPARRPSSNETGPGMAGGRATPQGSASPGGIPSTHNTAADDMARQTFRIARGETVRVHGRVDFRFVRHGHKLALEGTESPLMVDVAYDGVTATHHLYPPRDASWTWKDLKFTLLQYAYDDSMDLVVERVGPGGPPP